MGAESMRKAYLESTRRGVFGTTSTRIQAIAKKDEVEKPGPAHYQVKEKPFQSRYQQLSSNFASVTSRLTEPQATVKVRIFFYYLFSHGIFSLLKLVVSWLDLLLNLKEMQHSKQKTWVFCCWVQMAMQCTGSECMCKSCILTRCPRDDEIYFSLPDNRSDRNSTIARPAVLLSVRREFSHMSKLNPAMKTVWRETHFLTKFWKIVPVSELSGIRQ